MASSWTCPYCNQIATLQDTNVSAYSHQFNNANKDGDLAVKTVVVVCPNDKCKEYTITGSLFSQHREFANAALKNKGTARMQWRMKPPSTAQPIPEYVPDAIRDDYEEACLIASLSPKASATLSRRCLQGMIRDFWKVKAARLVDEIEAIKDKVDPQTWDAIDAVRNIGNIGAHMEKDINLIIEVDPDEATLLIGLIETLIDEWYVHRHSREEKMKAIVAAAAAKKDLKNQPVPAGAASTPKLNG